MKRKRTGRKRTKQEIVGLIFNIYLIISLVYCILMLILGEDIVMGNPVLRAMDDAAPEILIACVLLNAIALFSVRLWEKKYPPKGDESLSKDGDQHPPTD